jgi:NitT/TauT family transport system ATP-binding protein
VDTRVRIIKGTKSFQSDSKTRALFNNLNLEVNTGEILAICGLSGSGKTTLLRTVMGLESLDSGEVLIGEMQPTRVYPKLGYVVQDYTQSLLPWLTAQANVAFSLIGQVKSRKERAARAIDALKLVGMSEARRKRPWQLSGGMQQRVAIARALAIEPKVLCLDEPFGSLDSQTRMELQDMLLRLVEDRQITTILVTHDVEEAIYMSNRVMVLGPGGSDPLFFKINLDSPRDQLISRSSKAFIDLRVEILKVLRANKANEFDLELEK